MTELTKNLVSFKTWDGVNDENFKITVSLKTPIYSGMGGERDSRKTYI